MKRFWTVIALAGLVVAVAVIPAAAQSGSNPVFGGNIDVRFTAPMPFYVGDKLLAAGNYKVKPAPGPEGNALVVRGSGKNEAVTQYTAVSTEKPLAKIEVTFNKYGTSEYLNSIAFPGADPKQQSWVLQITPSAGEQAAAKAAAAAKHSVPGTK